MPQVRRAPRVACLVRTACGNTLRPLCLASATHTTMQLCATDEILFSAGGGMTICATGAIRILEATLSMALSVCVLGTSRRATVTFCTANATRTREGAHIRESAGVNERSRESAAVLLVRSDAARRPEHRRGRSPATPMQLL